MGSRDYRQRERKKPKKDEARKTAITSILPPVTDVEVIKAKGKKGREEAE